MTRQARIRAVIFDYSGTLFDDTSVIHGQSLARAAHRRGVELDVDTAEDLGRRIQERANSAEGHRARAGCDLSTRAHREVWTRLAASTPGVSAAVAGAFYDCIVDPELWRPYPDVSSTLAALRGGGVKIAVLSNTGWDIRTSFVRAGLYELIDAWVLSCEHGVEKPDPAIFALACAGVGVAPGSAVMVGDDPARDGPAIKAGLATYLLPAERRAGQPRGLHDVVALCGLELAADSRRQGP